MDFLIGRRSGDFVFQLIETVYAGFGFGRACLGHAVYPVQFLFEQFAVFFEFDFLIVHTDRLFFQESRVIAGIAVQLPPVEFYDRIADAVEEVAVVGDHEEGELGVAQILFQPLDHIEVEMVGGFV